MRRNKALRLGAVLAGTALVASACAGGDGGDGGGGGGGGKIEIVGAPGSESGAALAAEIDRIAEETGIDVSYVSLPDFDTVIQSRVRGGNAPAIALFPQPGVMLDFAANGDLKPLEDVIDVEAIGAQMVPGLSTLAVGEDGKTYGLPASINVKSIVWVAKPIADTLTSTPATTQDLLAVADSVKADGTPPWCFAYGAGAATGWYVTDWIEEFVVRIGGPEVYDQWTKGEVKFSDPVIKQAAEAFEEMVLAPGNAVLPRNAMSAQAWEDGMQPLVADPPGCAMARQGNFITGILPDEVEADLPTYLDKFLFPPYEGGYDGQPVMGGGDLVGVFDTENPDVKTVLEAIFTPEFGAEWAKGGQFISPFPEFDRSLYTNETLGDIAALVADADVFVFDGSDLMPGQVGSGAFWTEMTRWVGGETDLDSALANIDAAWPAN